MSARRRRGTEPQEAVQRHPGEGIFLPERMSYQDAIDLLESQQDAEGIVFQRRFNYRPLDGAVATDAVMADMGIAGVGKGTETLFGKIPPQRISVSVGLDEHVDAPWGEVTFTPLDGVLTIGAAASPRGSLFNLLVQAPTRRREDVEAFFDRVEAELRSNSIYRGQAIDGQDTPEFLDLTGVSEDDVVYSEVARAQLEANLWAPLELTKEIEDAGLSRRRRVLLEGPFGTGKTLAAFLTAQKAVANGVTFIYSRPEDNLAVTMQTARLYTPAIVFYEDVDRLTEAGDPEAAQQLLDVFDGLKAKPADVMVIATTNHRTRLHKGMLRPGRIDAVISVAEYDAVAAAELIRRVVREDLREDVDLEAVGEAFAGMTPAFVREGAERSVRYAIARTGKLTKLVTEDLLRAAEELTRHRQLMDEALEHRRPEGIDPALERLFRSSLRGAAIVDTDGDTMYELDPERDSEIVDSNGRR